MTDRRALINALMPEGSYNARPAFGVERRPYLYDGEMSYFRANPHVAGMAADDDRVVLNPFSKNTQQGQDAVALNEAARVYMRRNALAPNFSVTPQQSQQFLGTAYQNDPENMRRTLAARLMSGDPSAKDATQQHHVWDNRSLAPYQ
jgi:hypothetical protein